MDETVRINQFHDCSIKAEEDVVGRIAMAAIIAIIVLCLIGLFGLGFYQRATRAPRDDQENLVTSMENNTSRSEPVSADNVHYVVPKKEDEVDEPKVYVSTSNGLKKVERKDSSSTASSSSSNCGNRNGNIRNNKNGSQSEAVYVNGQSVTSYQKPAPELPKATDKPVSIDKVSHPLANLENGNGNTSGPPSISASSSVSNNSLGSSPNPSSGTESPNRSLGAIPKRRANNYHSNNIYANTNGNTNSDNDTSSVTSSSVSSAPSR